MSLLNNLVLQSVEGDNDFAINVKNEFNCSDCDFKCSSESEMVEHRTIHLCTYDGTIDSALDICRVNANRTENISPNDAYAVNLEFKPDNTRGSDLRIESVYSIVNDNRISYDNSPKQFLPILPKCPNVPRISCISENHLKTSIREDLQKELSSLNVAGYSVAVSSLCERLGVKDVILEYSKEDFINLTNHLVFTEYISAILEVENPEVPAADISEIAEAKWRQFLSIKESKTATKVDNVSHELIDLLSDDDSEEADDEGDEDYTLESAGSNGSQKSNYTTNPIQKYGLANEHSKVSAFEQNRKEIQSRWECSFCEFTCPTAEMYTYHLQTHRGENPYSCLICNQRFTERKDLKIHTTSIHNRDLDFKYFSCYHCDFRCKKSDNFTTHVLQHSDNDNGSRPFVCPTCFKGFRFKVYMKNHIRKVHFDRSTQTKIRCPDCNYTSFRRENMRDHMYTHTGEKPYGCPYCEYRCITATNLKVHLLVHTGEKRHVCEICGFKCTQRSSLKTHMKIHSNERSYLCTECGFRSNTSGNLLVHMRIHTGEKKYLCTICGSRFTQSQSLKTHINKVHSIYECPDCQKEFGEVDHLQTHMVEVHNCKPKLPTVTEKYGKNEKKYQCNECEKSFTQGHNLKLHKQKVHTNRQETEISENIGFNIIDTQENESSNNIKRVQTFKKFNCTECNKSFTQSHNLKAHMLKHTGEKPFGCKHCSYSCTTKNNLLQHIRRKHLVDDAYNASLNPEHLDDHGEHGISYVESDWD